MLDLRGDVCYNTITSEKVLFFCREPYSKNLSVRCFSYINLYGAGFRIEGGVYFYNCLSKSKKNFRKAGGAVMRVKITLACTECKQRNYNTMKNKKNDPDRLEMRKYCRFCRKHTLHKESK